MMASIDHLLINIIMPRYKPHWGNILDQRSLNHLPRSLRRTDSFREIGSGAGPLIGPWIGRAGLAW